MFDFDLERLMVALQRVRAGIKLTLPEVLPIVRDYFAMPGNEVGGELHVVLEDGNTEDHFIVSTIEDSEDRITRDVARLVLSLTRSQRRRLVRSDLRSIAATRLRTPGR